MNRRLTKSIFLGTFLGALTAALLWTAGTRNLHKDTTSQSEKPTQTAQSSPLPDFKVTAVQIKDDQKRIIVCENKQCHPLPTVESEGTSAVTDGASWYHYQSRTSDKDNYEKQTLLRTWIDSHQSDTIIEQTRLAKPRDLFNSPDNKKIAYWLDNIDQPNQQLTELWVYDSNEGGTKLLAEKIHQPGVITRPRWNYSSNQLWFIGNTSQSNEPDSLALHVISLQQPSLNIRFPDTPWADIIDIADHGAMDINYTGRSIAYATSQGNKTKIHIQHEDLPPEITTIRGTIPHLQWLQDGSLLYVVQNKHSFTFWRLSGAVHRLIANHDGNIGSVKSDQQERYFIYSVTEKNNINRTFTLDISTSQTANQGQLPSYGEHTYIIQLDPIENHNTDATTITTDLDDAEIAAFVDQHAINIIDETAQLLRLVITDTPNKVFVDYSLPDQSIHRLLLIINDASHAEWSISARYEELSGEWHKTEGGGLSDPNPTRLYEWEESVEQWILKENYES